LKHARDGSHSVPSIRHCSGCSFTVDGSNCVTFSLVSDQSCVQRPVRAFIFFCITFVCDFYCYFFFLATSASAPIGWMETHVIEPLIRSPVRSAPAISIGPLEARQKSLRKRLETNFCWTPSGSWDLPAAVSKDNSLLRAPKYPPACLERSARFSCRRGLSFRFRLFFFSHNPFRAPRRSWAARRQTLSAVVS